MLEAAEQVGLQAEGEPVIAVQAQPETGAVVG